MASCKRADIKGCKQAHLRPALGMRDATADGSGKGDSEPGPDEPPALLARVSWGSKGAGVRGAPGEASWELRAVLFALAGTELPLIDGVSGSPASVCG